MGANTDKALRVVLMGGDAKASSTKGAQLSLAALERGMKARFAPSDDAASRKRDMLKNFLAQNFPECLSDGHIDFETLRRTLGDWVEARNERFGLVWPGKAQCMKTIQQPSAATLNPDRAESVNFESTDNIFIEGENLEVLKLLQKSYFGKIKMIYIDPPYNTGQDFICPDKFAESLDSHLARTGQIDGDGRRFRTNTDTVGRYHTNC